MAMGRRAQQRQEPIWIAHTELPQTVAHPFYERLDQVLEERGFDAFVEQRCAGFYAERMGRPSLAPGRYFRLLLMGYFEGIDSERGMAWRAADSLALRSFLGVGLEEMPPDHSTISRTRRLIDVETHQAVFRWVLELLAEKGLLKGKTVGIDATTLEANAAMRCIQDETVAVENLRPFRANLMRRFPVSPLVNRVANDGPECSAAVDLPATTGSLFVVVPVLSTPEPSSQQRAGQHNIVAAGGLVIHFSETWGWAQSCQSNSHGSSECIRRQILTFRRHHFPIYDESLSGLWSDPEAELAVAI